MSAKILILDIETAPIVAHVWGLWDQNIGLNQIQKDSSILSYAAKWLDSKEILYQDTAGKNVRNDKPLLKTLWKLLDEADIVVAQNGAAFDIKVINGRLIQQGFGPYRPIRIVDTMLAAKKIAKFTSNKLEWLGKILTGEGKYKHSQFEGMDLWTECLKNNPAAWKEMKKYNVEDILRCESVYKKLRPWMDNHPNLGAYSDAERPICPNCGSAAMNKDKTRFHIKQQGVYIQYKCKDCGHYARGKTMVLTKEKRKSMLA